MKLTAGVLATQGAYALHLDVLSSLGVDVAELRAPEHLCGLDALVLPGGESTVMGKMICRWGLTEPLRHLIASGLPVMGTCAGLILLADRVVGAPQATGLGGLNITVERNAYGRQLDSFEAGLEMEMRMGNCEKESPHIKNYRAVFIRAPRIAELGEGVQVMARFEGYPVLVRQGSVVGSSFHPELSDSPLVHEWFLREVVEGG